jgi:hypothetical protein
MMVLNVKEPKGCNDCPLCQTIHLHTRESDLPIMASKCFVSRQKGFVIEDGMRMSECPIVDSKEVSK